MAQNFLSDIKLGDNIYIRLGSAANGDLHLHHNGNNSYIQNDVGHFYIKNRADDGDIVFQSDDGSGGVATYFTIDGGVGQNVFTKDIVAGDNIYLRIGNATDGDLQIYHGGTHSFIDNQTGNLYIRNYSDDKNIHFQTDDGSGGITDYIVVNGQENIVKFQENTRHLDNKQARFGTGSDLVIFHNSVNSFIQNSNGNLYIDNDADDADIYFRSDSGSGGKTAYFYLDGSAVNTRFVKDIKFSDSVKALFGGSSDLQIYHDGSNSYVRDTNEGNLYLDTNGDFIGLISDGSFSNGKMGLFYKDGAVKLYYDNDLKFETTSAGIDVTGQVTVDSNWVSDEGSLSIVHDQNTLGGIGIVANGVYKGGLIQRDGTAGNFMELTAYQAQSLKLRTSNTDAVTIDTSQNTTFAGDVTVTGDLIVNGTTTTINTATVEVEDNILQLNTTQGSPDTATAATSGISIYRGDGVTQASFIFDDGDDTWDLTNNLTIAGNIEATGTRTISAYFDSNHFIRLESNSSGGVLKGTDGGVTTILARSYGDSYFNGGNFGIGTNAPDGVLDVHGASGRWRVNTYGGMYFRNDSDTGHEQYIHARSDGRLSLGRAATSNWSGSGNATFFATTYDHLTFASNSDATFAGNITTSDSKISVTQADGDDLAKLYQTSADGFLELFTGEATPVSRIKLSSYGNSYINAASTGRLGIGTASPDVTMHVNAGTDNLISVFESTDAVGKIGLQDNTTSNNYSVAIGVVGDDMTLHSGSGGTEAIRINSSQNVGIGTNSPAQKLTVNGATFITGALTSPGSAGSYTYNGTAVDYHSDGARFWSWGNATTRGTFSFIQLENDGQNQQTALTIQQSGNAVFAGEVSGIHDLYAYKLYDSQDTNYYADLGNTGTSLRVAGSVGIGRSPVGKLTIEGDGGVNSNIFFQQASSQEHRIYAATNNQYNTIGSSSPKWYWGQHQSSGSPTIKMSLLGDALTVGTIASGNITVTGGGGGNGQVDIKRTSGAEIRIQAQSSLAKFGAVTNNHLQFMTNDTGRWNIENGGHLIPVADSSYDIGSNGTRVRNLYADTLYGDGSNLTNISATFNGGTVANATTFQGDVTINSAFPRIYLIDNNNNSDYSIINGNGTLRFYDDTNSADRLNITSGGSVVVNGSSARDASNPAKFSVQGGMSEFETTLTNNDDWQNSPISILERGNVGSTQTTNKYSPNLNFHWGGIVSRSLWMDSSGNLNYGEYDSSGNPGYSNGFIRAHEMHAGVFKDKDSTGYYLDPASTSTSLNVAGGAAFAGNVTVYTGASTGALSVGRNSAERLEIHQGDTNTTVTAFNDIDENQEHNFILDRSFGGSGGNNFLIRKAGSAQLSIDKDANATFAGDVIMSKDGGPTLNMNTNLNGNTSKILLHEGTTASPANGASIRYDGSANTFKIGVGSNVDTTRLTIDRGTGLATFANDVTVDGGDFNLTKQNGSPTINMLYDGTNPGTNTLLHYLNFKVDYGGTHQDWGGIEHRTNASVTRTDLRFNVKSQSGNVQTGLAIKGGSAAPLVGIGTSDPDAKLEILGNGRTSSTTSLRVRSDDDQQLFYVRDDGVVSVTHNYFYVDNPSGMYSNGKIHARGGVTDDGGTLGLGGSNAVDNLVLTSNTSALFKGHIHLDTLGSMISLYGNSSEDHAIVSKGLDGSADDDIRINSYGGVFINLDSNGNNDNSADFKIVRHSSTGAVSGSDTLFTLRHEDAHATFAGNTIVGGYLGVDNIKSDAASGVQFLTTGNAAQFIRTKAIQISSSYGGTPPTQGILFGTDTNLYRESSNVLKTDDSLVVAGDLTVNGTTTTVDQTNLDVADNIIGLNRGLTGTNANDSGIIIERGSSGDNAAFIWDESIGYFSFGTTQKTPSATGAVANESDWTWKPIKAGGATLTSTTSPILILNPTANNYGGVQFNYGGAVKGLAMYNSGFMVFGGESGTDTRLQAGGQYAMHIDEANRNIHIGATTDATYKLQVTGTFYVSGNATFASNTSTNNLDANHFGIDNTSSTTRDGVSLYGGFQTGEPTYGILFTGTSGFGTYGSVTSDWATYFTMNNNNARGWIFRKAGSGNTSSISAGGVATFGSSTQSPIFYDSNNTTYYLDPAATGTSLKAAGSVEHKGLSMTDGTNVDQVKQYNMTFQLTEHTWTDTGIDGTDLTTGTYAVQVYVDDHNVNGNHYDEYYSGTMSWYSGNTNSTSVDEIVLHRAGHAPNAGDIQLRTQRTENADSHDLMLQVKHTRTYNAALDNSSDGKIMRFKFRRLI